MRKSASVWLSTLLIVACTIALAPVALAQMSGMGPDWVDPRAENTIGKPVKDDELCDDEGGDGDFQGTLACEVTKVTTDLDAPVPSATFFGSFCESPTVCAGQSDGTCTPVLILAAGANFITIDLTGNTGPADVVFTIT